MPSEKFEKDKWMYCILLSAGMKFRTFWYGIRPISSTEYICIKGTDLTNIKLNKLSRHFPVQRKVIKGKNISATYVGKSAYVFSSIGKPSLRRDFSALLTMKVENSSFIFMPEWIRRAHIFVKYWETLSNANSL
jgi:hypothetical protein